LISGPVSVTGQVRGRTGNAKELLGSLNGEIEAEAGPGKFAKIGDVGDLFFRILSVASLKGLLSGRVLDNLTGGELGYQSLKTKTTITQGNLKLDLFRFESDAISLGSHGTCDLVNQQLNMQIELEPLGMVSTVASKVPLLGKAARELTIINIDVKGSLQDPKISFAMF